MEQVLSVATVDVKRKKSSFAGRFGRIFAFIIGGFGMLIAAILMITIIGIIPGFFMMMGSMGFIMASLGYQDVKCPSCDKKQTVLKNAEDFKCKRCNQPTIIHWT
jgi:hypothetical protein